MSKWNDVYLNNLLVISNL